MAGKRLNKKVAVIGSAIFALLVLLGIALVLYMSRDPGEFIRDGDSALENARNASDEQVKMEEYSRAERNYLRASGLVKTDDSRTEILFKLSNIYLETNQWRRMIECFNGIVSVDPENLIARHTRLEYVYIIADSGGGPAVWQEVASQASDLIKIIEGTDLAGSSQFRWKPLKEDQNLPTGKTLGSYLYLARGRARVTLAQIGATTEPDSLLAQAEEDLNKALEYEQDNIHVYWYLAQVALVRGEVLVSRGNLQARNNAFQQAESYIQQAIDKTSVTLGLMLIF
ncbi:MAG: tetratricopeptide repeat protein [Planctomycetota bacterium]|jgi:tetratricopeptide (TPR) repeat protein